MGVGTAKVFGKGEVSADGQALRAKGFMLMGAP